MKHFSVERKDALLRKMLPPLNLSVAELAQQEGVPDGTLYHWRKQAMAGGDMSAVSKRKAEGWSAESKLAAVVDGTAVGGGEPALPGEGDVSRAGKGLEAACFGGQQAPPHNGSRRKLPQY